MKINIVIVGVVWVVLGVCSAAVGQMRIVERDEGYQFDERDAPITLSTKIPLVLRYQLVLHKDTNLNQLFQAYGEKL